MGAYLFVHFIGRENSADCEQIYFSVSKDGIDWETLNGKKPVLRSDIGEKGARDPFIIKSPDGAKYYMIASDLSIYHRGNMRQAWYDCQEKGSRSILVWESENLTDWSEPRLAEIAVKDAGCAWAPEAMYDPDNDAYIVYWASAAGADNYEYQRMYRSYTKDFREFTPAEIYIDDAADERIKNGTAAANIDTTIIGHDGMYYRFTKNESKKTIVMDKSAHLSYGWERVKTTNLDEMLGYEGPTIVKMHDGKWGLFLDHFAEQKGYELFVTDDIDKGVFSKSADCRFDAVYRHGTVITITGAEYAAIIDKYGVSE